MSRLSYAKRFKLLNFNIFLCWLRDCLKSDRIILFFLLELMKQFPGKSLASKCIGGRDNRNRKDLVVGCMLGAGTLDCS